MAIPTHGGIETQHIASRLSFPDKGKETGVNRTQNAPIEKYSRRDQTQNIPIETHDRHNPSAKRPNKTTPPRRQTPRAQTPVPALQPAKRSLSPAHNSRTFKAEYRPAASARNNARLYSSRPPIPNCLCPRTQKIPPHPIGRSGICECDYFATVREVTWGLEPSYQ